MQKSFMTEPADLNDIAVFVRVAQYESFSRAARALGMREDGERLVTVEAEDADLRIDVAIGVLAGFGARDTVRRVHDAIVAEFRHDGWENANVRVTVVHIADDATTTPEHTASAEEGDVHD